MTGPPDPPPRTWPHEVDPGADARRPPRGGEATSELHRVLAAEGISNFGAMLSRLAIPWLAALVLDATPLQMAALLVADVAAAALAALWIGAWVERRGKRAVMLLCDGLRAGVLAVLALLAWRGAASMAALAIAAAANGVLTMAFELARSAWMAQRVAAEGRVHANARLSMVSSLSETAAFALGGWIFQWLGAMVALLIDALSYVASALCLRGVGEAGAVMAKAPATSGVQAAGSRLSVWRGRAGDAWREVAAGLSEVAAHPWLRALAVIEVLLALGMALAGTSYMIYVTRDLALPTGPLGVVFAIGGIGSVLGARVAAAAESRLGRGRAMTLGLALAAAGAACVPLAAPGSAAWLAITWLVMQQLVGDAGHTLYAVHDRTLRQSVVEPALLARADAAIRFGGQAATLVGALAGGVLGTALGARGALALCAAVLAAAALYAALRLAAAGVDTGAAADAGRDARG